jgi:hypothetical protein
VAQGLADSGAAEPAAPGAAGRHRPDGVALYTGLVLRTCHHWAGVAWDGSSLFDSTLTQAALSVAWSAVGVGLMLLGHRRAQRVVWVVGAMLLGIVVAKLFLSSWPIVAACTASCRSSSSAFSCCWSATSRRCRRAARPARPAAAT